MMKILMNKNLILLLFLVNFYKTSKAQFSDIFKNEVIYVYESQKKSGPRIGCDSLLLISNSEEFIEKYSKHECYEVFAFIEGNDYRVKEKCPGKVRYIISSEPAKVAPIFTFNKMFLGIQRTNKYKFFEFESILKEGDRFIYFLTINK